MELPGYGMTTSCFPMGTALGHLDRAAMEFWEAMKSPTTNFPSVTEPPTHNDALKVLHLYTNTSSCINYGLKMLAHLLNDPKKSEVIPKLAMIESRHEWPRDSEQKVVVPLGKLMIDLLGVVLCWAEFWRSRQAPALQYLNHGGRLLSDAVESTTLVVQGLLSTSSKRHYAVNMIPHNESEMAASLCIAKMNGLISNRQAAQQGPASNRMLGLAIIQTLVDEGHIPPMPIATFNDISQCELVIPPTATLETKGRISTFQDGTRVIHTQNFDCHCTYNKNVPVIRALRDILLQLTTTKIQMAGCKTCVMLGGDGQDSQIAEHMNDIIPSVTAVPLEQLSANANAYLAQLRAGQVNTGGKPSKRHTSSKTLTQLTYVYKGTSYRVWQGPKGGRYIRRGGRYIPISKQQ